MKKYLVLTLLVGCVSLLRAQTENPSAWTHTIGLQANPLLRQILNLGTTTATNNPYLLTYHLSHRNNWGLRVGGGIQYQQIKNNDGVTSRNSGITNYAARLGVERLHDLGKGWQVGYGLDGILSDENNSTTATSFTFDTITTVSKIRNTVYGGGAMVWLRYSFNSHIQIGTESSVYFQTGTQKQRLETTRKDFNQPGFPKVTTTENLNNSITQVNFSVPVAIYLLVRF